MTKVNIHEAKSQLSKLIELAKNGEEVVIAKNGKPQARLIACRETESRDSWLGMDAGKIWIADDFDILPDDILEAFYGETVKEAETPD